MLAAQTCRPISSDVLASPIHYSRVSLDVLLSVGNIQTHDTTAASRHRIDLGPDAGKDAPRIHREVEIPVRVRHARDGASGRDDAGHVDGAVELAQPLHGQLDPRVDRLAVAHVDDLSHVPLLTAAAAAARQRLERGRQRLFVQIG